MKRFIRRRRAAAAQFAKTQNKANPAMPNEPNGQSSWGWFSRGRNRLIGHPRRVSEAKVRPPLLW
jgi:hypothetical protein